MMPTGIVRMTGRKPLNDLRIIPLRGSPMPGRGNSNLLVKPAA